MDLNEDGRDFTQQLATLKRNPPCLAQEDRGGVGFERAFFSPRRHSLICLLVISESFLFKRIPSRYTCTVTYPELTLRWNSLEKSLTFQLPL